MRKLIVVITTVFFLMGPAFLFAQGTEGNLPGGNAGSVTAEKVEKKSSKAKKKSSKKAKKHSKKKAKKASKPAKDINTVPKS
jgi:hypothetical protein